MKFLLIKSTKRKFIFVNDVKGSDHIDFINL